MGWIPWILVLLLCVYLWLQVSTFEIILLSNRHPKTRFLAWSAHFVFNHITYITWWFRRLLDTLWFMNAAWKIVTASPRKSALLSVFPSSLNDSACISLFTQNEIWSKALPFAFFLQSHSPLLSLLSLNPPHSILTSSISILNLNLWANSAALLYWLMKLLSSVVQNTA